MQEIDRIQLEYLFARLFNILMVREVLSKDDVIGIVEGAMSKTAAPADEGQDLLKRIRDHLGD